MATFFKNSIINNIGLEPVTIYETGPADRATVIGLSLTNLTQNFVYVDVMLKDDSSIVGFYSKQTLVGANTSLRLVNQGEKLILAPSNVLMVRSSANDSIDSILSYVEVV
jgi:hypothetical protein